MTSKINIIYTLLAYLLCLCNSAIAAQCNLPDHSLLDSPKQNRPVQVKVSIYVLDIESVDDQKQQFTSDFIVEYIWQDQRLGKIARQSKGTCNFKLNEVWNPEIQIFNVRKLTTRLNKLIKVDTKGVASYMQRYYGTLASPLDLKGFPFDRQILPYIFISMYDNKQVIIEDDPTLTGQDPTFSIAGWNNSQLENLLTVYQPQSVKEASTQPEYTQLEYFFKIERDVQYYRWKVVLPLSLIVIMSWAVFWIEPGQLGPRLSVSTTSLLTVIAFLFSLRGILPPVSYLTRMDYFIYGSIFLIFLTHIIALMTSSFSAKEKYTEAKTIIRFSRFIVPGSFILNAIYFLLI